MTVWSEYCMTKNILMQTPVWWYIRRHIWRQGRACSIIAQDLKSHHGNAYPQLWVQAVENFQMPSTVCATYTNIACRHSFQNSVAKEKKLRTWYHALAWIQMHLLQRDALITDIISPRKRSRDWLLVDWDFLSEIPSSMGRRQLEVMHTSATMLTVSVRDSVFFRPFLFKWT